MRFRIEAAQIDAATNHYNRGTFFLNRGHRANYGARLVRETNDRVRTCIHSLFESEGKTMHSRSAPPDPAVHLFVGIESFVVINESGPDQRRQGNSDQTAE